MGQMIVVVWGIPISALPSRTCAQKEINLIKAITNIPDFPQRLSKEDRIKVVFEVRGNSAVGLEKKEAIIVVALTGDADSLISFELRKKIFTSLEEAIREDFSVDSVKILAISLRTYIPEILMRYI